MAFFQFQEKSSEEIKCGILKIYTVYWNLKVKKKKRAKCPCPAHTSLLPSLGMTRIHLPIDRFLRFRHRKLIIWAQLFKELLA